MTQTLPPLTERDFQRQVTELAALLGWTWLHIRPGMTRDSWRTPISGPLGKGWPDLVLVRPRDRRLIFAELKRDGAKLAPDQELVLEALRSIEHYPTPLDLQLRQKPPVEHPSIQVVVWYPADWAKIERVLR